MSGAHIESSLGDTSILDGATRPIDPATQTKVAALLVANGHADLLPMMQLTDADLAANRDRWAAFVEAAPSAPVVDDDEDDWACPNGCCG